jgi:hypothetical protein
MGAVGASATQSPIATTSDRVGDGRGAPDICEVAISRNASTVGFKITFADRPSLEPGERVTLVLDSDQSEATGNPYLTGADILLSYGTLGEQTFAGEFLRWNGTRWDLASEDRRKVKFLVGESVLKVVLDRRLLRGLGFDWLALTFQAGKGRGTDSAPDDGVSSYSLQGGAHANDGRRNLGTIRSIAVLKPKLPCGAVLRPA